MHAVFARLWSDVHMSEQLQCCCCCCKHASRTAGLRLRTRGPQKLVAENFPTCVDATAFCAYPVLAELGLHAPACMRISTRPRIRTRARGRMTTPGARAHWRTRPANTGTQRAREGAQEPQIRELDWQLARGSTKSGNPTRFYFVNCARTIAMAARAHAGICALTNGERSPRRRCEYGGWIYIRGPHHANK